MKHLLPYTLGLAGILSAAPVTAKKPLKNVNFVLIYLDDMGNGDLSITGAQGYTTPNIDQMARNGVRFTSFYSPQAVSSASRAGLLTGCYPNRVGITGALDHTAKIGISSEEMTIAQVLKQKGYSCAAFGKWHLGCLKPFLPTHHGFDEFFGIPYSHDMTPDHPATKKYYPPLPLYEGDEVKQTDPDRSQFTREFTERTIDFIRKNKDHPFFAYLAHPLPHVPLAASDRFRGKTAQGLYGDVMSEIDWSVGQILKTLKELKLDKNTLVIFTSDNGPWINYGNHAGSTGGLREGKGTSFEGGQRLPCIMMWDGTIPKGVICNNLASGIDLLPTMAEIAGAPLPQKKIDGVSLAPLLKGDFSIHPRKSFLYYYRKNSLEAVRNENFKLVFAHPGRTYEGFLPGKDGQPGKVNENFMFTGGLYDLRRDPGERYDVSAMYPEVVRELEAIALEAREDLGDDITGNPGKNRRQPGKIEK